MSTGLVRSAALLAALVVLLNRGIPSPADVAVAGTVGLAVYAALTVIPAAVRRLLDAS